MRELVSREGTFSIFSNGGRLSSGAHPVTARGDAHPPAEKYPACPHLPGRPAPVPAGDRKDAPIAPRADAAQRLWLCVYLPGLAVDVFRGGIDTPLAATETIKNHIVIAACNNAAERSGVRAGMTLASALSLCGGLRSAARDRAAECRKLNEIATIAYRLSGTVSLYGEDSIVLEIKGSFRLLGGLREVLRQAGADLGKTGVCFTFGIAGTPRAACWLARWHPGTRVLFPEELPAVLRQLPVEVLGCEENTLQQFRRSGIKNLGALLRLPRDGVARRFGPAILKALDQALGYAPEPLALFSPPQAFRASEDLCLPCSDWPRLEPPAGKLLRRLEHYLLRQQAATQRVDCLLRHAHEAPTRIRLSTSRYERRAEQLLDLLRRHFEKTALPAEVTALDIHCADIHAIPPESLHLIDGIAETEQRWSQLLDRLIARIGERRLSKPDLRDDHRPEKSNAEKKGDSLLNSKKGQLTESELSLELSKLSPFFPQRPAWLLPRPAPLGSVLDRPDWNGPLELSRLPERIEQGWWDGHDLKRDYYLAKNPDGARLWIFRDRGDRRWYLHGVFA